MRTKPRILNYVAIFLLTVSLGLPLQIMFLYGHGPLETGAIAAKLTPLNWIILLLAPLCAWLVYRASPFLLAVVPTLSLVVVHNNWLVAEIGTDYSPLLAGLSTGLFIAMMSTLVTREVRQAVLNPELHWWNTPTRLKAEIPVLIGADSKQYYATTFDISETGAFIPLDAAKTQALPAALPLKVGAKCSLFFSLRKLSSIQCDVEVVRTTESRGNYPAGIGVRFLNLDREKRRLLHSFVELQSGAKA